MHQLAFHEIQLCFRETKLGQLMTVQVFKISIKSGLKNLRKVTEILSSFLELQMTKTHTRGINSRLQKTCYLFYVKKKNKNEFANDNKKENKKYQIQ
jgi:hypothetical protein